MHDELVFECPQESADEAMVLIRKVMESAASPVLDLSVPLIAEAATGISWDEAH